MIEATIYKDKKGAYKGFNLYGHALYDVKGKDIVCAAVSALVINTINSIEELTDDKPKVLSKEKDAVINVKFKSEVSNEAKILIDSLVLGLKGIRDNNNESYLKITFEEV